MHAYVLNPSVISDRTSSSARRTRAVRGCRRRRRPARPQSRSDRLRRPHGQPRHPRRGAGTGRRERRRPAVACRVRPARARRRLQSRRTASCRDRCRGSSEREDIGRRREPEHPDGAARRPPGQPRRARVRSRAALGDEWSTRDLDLSEPLQDLATVFDQIDRFTAEHWDDVGAVAQNLSALGGTLVANRSASPSSWIWCRC